MPNTNPTTPPKSHKPRRSWGTLPKWMQPMAPFIDLPTNITLTSTAVAVFVSTPMQYILGRMQLGVQAGTKPGRLAAIRSIWGALPKNIAAGNAKGGASISGRYYKGSAVEEGALDFESGSDEIVRPRVGEQKQVARQPLTFGQEMSFAFAFGLGEYVVASPFEKSGQIIVSPNGINKIKYNGHNIKELLKMGAVPRLGANFLNFTALLVAQERIKKGLFAHSSPLYANLGSGAIAGVCATVLTHPLQTMSDHVTLSSTQNAETGLLSAAKTSTFFKSQVVAPIKSRGITACFIDFYRKTGFQNLVRMGRVGGIFAVIAAAEEYIGKEPVSSRFTFE